MLLFSRFFKSFFSKYLSINSFTIFSVFHFLLVPSLLNFIIKAKGKDDIEAYNKALYNFKPLSMNSISHEQEIQGFVITNNRWYTSSIIPLYGGTIMIIIVLTVIINFDSILKLLNIH